MGELLGTASFPSGDVLLIDFGLLRLWSGDRAPEPGPETDFEIAGPDAREVAAALDLAVVKGRYAFDLEDGSAVAAKVAEVCRTTGLDAALRPTPRTAHHTRVRRLLEDHPGGAEVPFPGGWAVAVRGVPAGRELRVLGERMDAGGPDAGKWHSVWVECAEGAPVKAVECGYVLVDEARLLFADPAALNGWRSDVPYDGRYDLVFWGADAAAAADRVSASTVDDDGVFGWTGLTRDEAASRHHELQGLGELRFRFDLRPHDDHYRVLQQMYRSPAESGTIEVGGATMTGWFTGWGDGAYPVFRDLAADGTLLRVRVELGAPEIVRRQRRFEQLWFGDLAKLALVSARVAREGAPVTWLHREAADNDQDSGWRVFAGDETQDYLDDAANCQVVPLRDLIRADPGLEELFGHPAPAAFERAGPDVAFVPVPAEG
ncbi:DUF2185 domain-containing protein [Amycolatopsis sp. NPDC049252]|uniref:DUF2185 domain-containing protein n=1 Tax=Amycolatopsis sp. NPDC049252 TaxID=3363933 RepID=UPI00371E9C70